MVLTSTPFQQDKKKAAKEPEPDSDPMSRKVHVNKLLLLGLLYCQGDHKEKTHAFYDILQDSFQDHISASDKELLWAYVLLLKLSSFWVHKWAKDIFSSTDLTAGRLNQNFAKLDEACEDEYD
jgi:hypothetical protein